MEVFASIQGEGTFVGEPQSFLRLRGCPLRCRWCDTKGSWELAPEPLARIHAAEARSEPAWASPFQVALWIAEVEGGRARTVSVTGGEPLIWSDFLCALPSFLGQRRLHLETAGAHPLALARVLEVFDHVSFDLKLPADLGPPVELPEPSEYTEPLEDFGASELCEPSQLASEAERAPEDASGWRRARRACLELLAERDACAKLIVSGGHRAEEYDELLDDLAELAIDIPLVVQPVTPMNAVAAAPLELIDEVCEQAAERALGVRVLPQVHRILGRP